MIVCDVYLGVKVFKSNHVSEAYYHPSLKTYVSVSLHSVTEKTCNVYVYSGNLYICYVSESSCVVSVLNDT